MDRDKSGRFAPGTAPGPGRTPGIAENRPRKRPRSVRIVTGEHLQLATLDQLDRRATAGRRINERYRELVMEFDRRLTEIEYGICRQIAYLEFRLSVMQARELGSGSFDLDPIPRAQRELRAWHNFLEVRMSERGYRSAEHARRLTRLAVDAGLLGPEGASSSEG